MTLYNTLGKRTPHKPLLSWEDAWALDRAQDRSGMARGGVQFAQNIDGAEKSAARRLILDLFHPDKWPDRLRMLTMPGLHWKFERKLLGMREGDWMSSTASPARKTHFTSAENNRSIFTASMHKLPRNYREIIQETAPWSFAEIGFSTGLVTHFFCNVDDLMGHEWDRHFDAAWLDYTGPLSIERLNLIRRFHEKYLGRGILIITALRARWNRESVDAIEKAGGHSEWLRQNLAGAILHDIKYMDTSPMAQFAVSCL